MNDLAGARHADARGGPRWRTRALVLAVLLAVPWGVTGLVWKREHDRASVQERIALAHGLALHAAELRDTAPAMARNLGLAAVEIHSDEQTRAGLIDTLVGMHSDVLSPDASGEVVLSDDGRIALAGGDELGVWDLTTWLEPKIVDKADRIAVLKDRREGLSMTALSGDGRTVLTGGGVGDTVVWDLTDPAKPIRVAALVGGKNAEDANSVRAMALSRDGRTAAIADLGGDLIMWNLTDRSHPARLSVAKLRSSSVVRDLRLSADGGIAVISYDGLFNNGAVAIWDLSDPSRPVKSADLGLPAGKYARATVMDADGHVILVGNAHRAEIWNLDDRSHPVRTAALDVPFTDLYGMAVTSDGKTALLAGPSDSAILWNLSDPYKPARLAALKGYTREINSVALGADGEVALAAGPGGTYLWDLRGLAEVVADPERAACRDNPGTEISKADWARYTGGADWSDYKGEDLSDALAVCAIRRGSL
ncbi:WD40 repeat domain-containing protein [Microbispora sp. H10830]|uniref:WD40 repeat domain-containing protein n=1 Tax=Microbispora sp. H10830 TaxID=2729109 RepID=UPI0015FF7C53|nr:WD40 repeat domain-containing protein [Microbispora sp. H10830]